MLKLGTNFEVKDEFQIVGLTLKGDVENVLVDAKLPRGGGVRKSSARC